ncbi:MAG: methylenetetrahydrofolate--tRNA-(uracil(54)-C(5))-methyltransferase (FADH(2)-oxidizing) TrmFO [Magnetococcales bacterium]|nr:methylenetetrahydrofolate--tRNA-(uracil(54)-C(5))-methyltransferase (FADH(2)-oxidizing) TrmFO [Magnetococcales bacterium]
MTPPPVHIIGAGLAGSEAAWQLAQRGVPVRLSEMRPTRSTPAHHSGDCGELVCSNSLGGDDPERNASGTLHAEMRRMGSLVMAAADACRVPAGGALAVDREGFARWITQRLLDHPRITLHREEVVAPDGEGMVILATGPLTSDPLAQWMDQTLGAGRLSFYDAIAPVVSLESIDFTKAWRQSRYDRGTNAEGDYINCPLLPAEYTAFVEALRTAEKVPWKDFEKVPPFEGCMPVETLAERGPQTLRFGPMKPVGLNNPGEAGRRPYAVVQLRQDNALGTLWNLVGFQTKMTWPEQRRVFAMIPGLERAEFVRLGSVHRNTYLESPRLLTPLLQWRQDPRIFFAGQITGVEGYSESALSGLLVGRYAAALRRGETPTPPPLATLSGALMHYVAGGGCQSRFQPMNANFGLLPPLDPPLPRKENKPVYSRRALEEITRWLAQDTPDLANPF